MTRGLHMKLVLIMLLLIVSLMTVVCAFLIRGVQGFYRSEFYEQMQSTFSNTELVSSLRSAADLPGADEKMEQILGGYSGLLGIDYNSRNYYVLDGKTGTALAGGSQDLVGTLEITPNILTALTGEEGDDNSATAPYMDVAIPIAGESGTSYIVYIRDNKQVVQDLNMELFLIIMQALVIGLIISVLLSFLLSKTMVTPIQSLTRAAELVAGGDFSSKIEVQAKDEIGVLTNTFNNMATKLQDTLEDIESERNKLSTVFRHMTDGLVAFSRDEKLIHFNPAAERMLGKSLHDTKPTYTELFGEFASTDEVFDMSGQDYLTVGERIGDRELEIFLATFAGEGAQGGILAVIHDITEQKKSDALRREFVANVSHELRTPITNIRGYAETLLDTADLPKEMEADFLRVILSESDRMTKIVQDLLSLSRFDAGNLDLAFERFSIEDSVKDVCSAITIEASKHGHTLNLHFDEALPKISGDKARIEQVVVNIISNAVKYTPDGGIIDVHAYKEEKSVVIKVTDNGIGIPKDDLPRIFERFYRVDKARSRAYGGTGLGLSIAQEIISRHGGSIEIESAHGEGATVTVRLPIEATSQEKKL